MSILSYRNVYPEYNDLTDDQIIKALREKHPGYEDLSDDEFLYGLTKKTMDSWKPATPEQRADWNAPTPRKSVQTPPRSTVGMDTTAIATRISPADRGPTITRRKPVVATNKNFDTVLTAEEESRFQEWKSKNAPNDSGIDYDLRGAFKAGVKKDATGHWPDTWKKPNHPTFSNESLYYQYAPEKAGRWENNQFVPSASMTPSKDMKDRSISKAPWDDPRWDVDWKTQGKKKTLKTKIADVKERPYQAAPYVAGAADLEAFAELGIAVKHARAGVPSGRDLQIIKRFTNYANTEESFGYKVGSTVAQLPKFWGELMTTGGIYTAGKKVGEKAAMAAMKTFVKKEAPAILEKFGERSVKNLAALGARKAAGVVAGGIVQSIPSQATTTLANVAQRTIPQFHMEGDQIVIDRGGESLSKAIPKAFTDSAIEVVSENTGRGLRFGGKLLNRMKPIKNLSDAARETALRSAMVSAIVKANKGANATAVKKFMEDKFRFNGVLEEMFEERVGDVSRLLGSTVGLSDFQSPTIDQLGVEFVSFLVPNAGGSALGMIADRIRNQNAERKSTAGAKLVPQQATRPPVAPRPAPTVVQPLTEQEQPIQQAPAVAPQGEPTAQPGKFNLPNVDLLAPSRTEGSVVEGPDIVARRLEKYDADQKKGEERRRRVKEGTEKRQLEIAKAELEKARLAKERLEALDNIQTWMNSVLTREEQKPGRPGQKTQQPKQTKEQGAQALQNWVAENMPAEEEAGRREAVKSKLDILENLTQEIADRSGDLKADEVRAVVENLGNALKNTGFAEEDIPAQQVRLVDAIEERQIRVKTPEWERMVAVTTKPTEAAKPGIKVITPEGERIAPLTVKPSKSGKADIWVSTPKTKGISMPKSVVDFASENKMEFVGLQEGYEDVEKGYMFNIPEATNTTISIPESKLNVDEISRVRDAKIIEFKGESAKKSVSRPAEAKQVTSQDMISEIVKFESRPVIDDSGVDTGWKMVESSRTLYIRNPKSREVVQISKQGMTSAQAKQKALDFISYRKAETKKTVIAPVSKKTPEKKVVTREAPRAVSAPVVLERWDKITYKARDGKLRSGVVIGESTGGVTKGMSKVRRTSGVVDYVAPSQVTKKKEQPILKRVEKKPVETAKMSAKEEGGKENVKKESGSEKPTVSGQHQAPDEGRGIADTLYEKKCGRAIDTANGILGNQRNAPKLREAVKKGIKPITFDSDLAEDSDFKILRDAEAKNGVTLVPIKDSTNSIEGFVTTINGEKYSFVTAPEKGSGVTLSMKQKHEASHGTPEMRKMQSQIDISSEAFKKYRKSLEVEDENGVRGIPSVEYALEEMACDLLAGCKTRFGVNISDALIPSATRDVSKLKDVPEYGGVPDPGWFMAKSVTSEQDVEYLKAVKQNDMKTAQRMVDEAAKRAGYTIKAFHGTNSRFNKIDFKKGAQGLFWFSSDRQSIETGESGAQGTKKIMGLYVKIKKSAGWDEYNKYSISELDRDGYDGAILLEKDGSFDGFVFNEPSQVKSSDPVTRDNSGRVIPLSKRFNPKKEDIRFMSKAKRDEYGFFSGVEQAVLDLKQEKGTGKQLFKMIQDSPGAKRAELEWMGLPEFFGLEIVDVPTGKFDEKNYPITKPDVKVVNALLAEKKFTKQEIADFVRANSVRTEEKVLGDVKTTMEAFEEDDGSWSIRDTKNNAIVDTGYMNERAAKREIYNLAGIEQPISGYAPIVTGDTKFSQWKTPGGTIYREMLFLLPENKINFSNKSNIQKYNDFINLMENKYGKDAMWEKMDDNEYDQFERLESERFMAGSSSSRAELKTEYEKKNFISSHWNQPNVFAHARVQDFTSSGGGKILLVDEVQSDWEREARARGMNAPLSDAEKEELVSLRKKVTTGTATDAEDARWQALTARKEGAGVPDFPFRKSGAWYEFAMKRLLRYAAENGYDAVAWTTGEMQKERYDLSKYIDRVEYNEKTKRLFAPSRTDDTAIRKEGILPEHLDQYIGKDAAKRIMEQTPDTSGMRVLKGLDLKVGGEWAIALYDRTIPSFLNRYTKKFGGKVESFSIVPSQSGDEWRYVWVNPYGISSRGGKTPVEAETRKPKNNGPWTLKDNAKPFHALPITPSMRESVLEGQPRFMAKEPSAEEKIKLRERGFISTVKKQGPEEVKSRVAGQYVPRDTDELQMKAAVAVRNNPLGAEEFIKRDTSDKGVAIAAELMKYYTGKAYEARQGGESGAEDVMWNKVGDIAEEEAERLTELGRAIQAASIYGYLTPEGMVRFAARHIKKYNAKAKGYQKKIPNLTAQQIKDISDKAERISTMPDGEAKAIAWFRIQTEIARLIPTPGMKKLVNLWKAGLLTGVKTSFLNTSSNLAHGVSETAKDIPAVIFDTLMSAFTGKRSVTMTMRGVGRGWKYGWRQAKTYWSTGFDLDNAGKKLDALMGVYYGDSKTQKAVQWYVDHVFRCLGMQDKIFFWSAYARSMYSQAYAAAKNENVSPRDMDSFVKDFVRQPTEDARNYAMHDAEVAVFRNKTVLGYAAQNLQRIGGGLGHWVIPFSRTPAAVAMQMYNYSPLGLPTEIMRQIKNKKLDQRTLSQAFGRSAFGTTSILIGIEIFKAGLMALVPDDDKERRQWALEGKKQNTIFFNGAWRNPNVLGPLGSVLLTGGYFAKSLKETGSFSAALSTAVAGGGKTLKDQTFLTGLSSFMDAINAPDKKAKTFLQSQFGSVIPTIVSDLAAVTDRDKDGKIQQRELNGILDGIMKRSPGLREKLEPQLSPLGQRVRLSGNVAEWMLDPTRPSRGIPNDIVDELKRLDSIGYNATPTYMTPRKGYKALTNEENTALEFKAGVYLESALRDLFLDPTYVALSPEDQVYEIDKRVTASRYLARAEYCLSSIARSTDKKKREQELVESKVLNDSVRKVMKGLSMGEYEYEPPKRKKRKTVSSDEVMEELSGGEYETPTIRRRSKSRRKTRSRNTKRGR